MTDLISKLADALVALNNASPRLPRKEQIEEVLRAGLSEMVVVDRQTGGGFIWSGASQTPMFSLDDGIECVKVDGVIGHDLVFAAGDGSITTYLATQEQLVKAADAICAEDLRNCIMPLPYKEPSPEYKQALEYHEQWRREAYEAMGIGIGKP